MPGNAHLHHHRRCGLTLLETVVSLLLITVLLAILLPALSSARVASYGDQCKGNLYHIGQSWQTYLEDHQRQFPFVPVQPGWFYGGMRFSSVDGSAYRDNDRPLTPYLPLPQRSTSNNDEIVCCCPADHGITDPSGGVGTGKRSAFRGFGTSYRANAALLDARLDGIDGAEQFFRGLKRREITTSPSRLVLMGDPVWYEVAEATGRTADWHGRTNAGNILFLDGAVRFMTIKPRTDRNQPLLFDPIMPGGFVPDDQSAGIEPASSAPSGAAHRDE